MKVKIEDLWKYAFSLQSFKSIKDTTQIYFELNEEACPGSIEAMICDQYTKIKTMNCVLIKEKENDTVAETCAKDIAEKKQLSAGNDILFQYEVRKFKEYYAYQAFAKNIPCDRYDFIMGRYSFITPDQLSRDFNRATEIQQSDLTIDQIIKAGIVNKQYFNLVKSIFFEHKSFNVSIPEKVSVTNYNVVLDISEDLIGTPVWKLFEGSVDRSKNSISNTYTWKLSLVVDGFNNLARIDSIKLYDGSLCIKKINFYSTRTNNTAYETICFALDPILDLTDDK
jgi:hypothetical protein